jgi:hypothetical protein
MKKDSFHLNPAPLAHTNLHHLESLESTSCLMRKMGKKLWIQTEHLGGLILSNDCPGGGTSSPPLILELEGWEGTR